MADKEQSPDGVDEAELLSRELPLEYYGTEHVVGIFADQVMVSHSTGLFTLSFFQVQVPPTTDMEVLSKLDKIPARCVSKIILMPPLVEQFFAVMEENLIKYKERLAVLEKAKGKE